MFNIKSSGKLSKLLSIQSFVSMTSSGADAYTGLISDIRDFQIICVKENEDLPEAAKVNFAYFWLLNFPIYKAADNSLSAFLQVLVPYTAQANAVYFRTIRILGNGEPNNQYGWKVVNFSGGGVPETYFRVNYFSAEVC